jgi:hypothetical protein
LAPRLFAEPCAVGPVQLRFARFECPFVLQLANRIGDSRHFGNQRNDWNLAVLDRDAPVGLPGNRFDCGPGAHPAFEQFVDFIC